MKMTFTLGPDADTKFCAAVLKGEGTRHTLPFPRRDTEMPLVDASRSGNHIRGCITLCRTTVFLLFLTAWQDRLGISLQLQKHSAQKGDSHRGGGGRSVSCLNKNSTHCPSRPPPAHNYCAGGNLGSIAMCIFFCLLHLNSKIKF